MSGPPVITSIPTNTGFNTGGQSRTIVFTQTTGWPVTACYFDTPTTYPGTITGDTSTMFSGGGTLTVTTPAHPDATVTVYLVDGNGTGTPNAPISDFTFSGDPHFVSFRGEKFEFQGKPDKYFNIYSDANIQINSLFTYWETSGTSNLTIITELGIKFSNLRIKIDAASQTVTVNDIIVTDAIFGCGFIKTVDEIPKKYESIKDTQGFETFIKGVIVRILDYDTFIAFSTDHVNQVFINLIMKIAPEVLEGLDAHGVVGQTAMYKGPPRKSMGPNGAGIIQGSYRDYEVCDLFEDDFKFNKWIPIEEKLIA